MPSITIEQYIQHYNDQDYINKIAILILDINTILGEKYEDEVLPYLCNYDMPKMEEWLTDYLDKGSLSRLKNGQITSREYSYDIGFKKMDCQWFLNMKDINGGKRIHKLDERIQGSSFFTTLEAECTAVADVDLLQALKKIYIATLYIENQKVQSKYSELQKNLEFMKKFMRDCFTK